MKQATGFFSKIRNARWVRAVLPPFSVLLVGIYPALYYYAQNSKLVRFSSLSRLLPLLALMIALIYLIALAFNRRSPVRAANAAIIFLVFFHTYGIVFERLLETDFVLIKNYLFLPLYLFIAVYAAWLITRLNKNTSLSLWRIITLVFAVLTVFSIARIIPHEVKKARTARNQPPPVSINVQPGTGGPDIYYLVFDEFSGLEAMRQYWKNPQVEPFKNFLEESGFYVIEGSQSSNLWTLHQVATRLNYFDYEYVRKNEDEWLYSIANNKAMSFLKSRGYTTVMLEEFSWFYATMPEIRADYWYNTDMFETLATRILYDEFGIMVVDATMLYPVTHQERYLEMKYNSVGELIEYARARVPDLADIPSPKFLYMHLNIPHWPFLYHEDGSPINPQDYKNWAYYEEYYNYTIKVIEQLVTAILANADPQNPPVIILQSDHGARAKLRSKLPGFPAELETDILFAVFLPGFDTSTLPQNLDPINTLPIIFNHYFGANIQLQ